MLKKKLLMFFILAASMPCMPARALDIQVGAGANTPASQAAVQNSSLPLKVTVFNLTENPKVGDEVRLMVKLIYQPGVAVVKPSLPATLGDWDVLAREYGKPERIEDHWARVDYLRLRTFISGDVELPALVQPFQGLDGKPAEFRTSPLKIKVAPLATRPGDQPGVMRGLKPPLGLISWWQVAGLLLVLALILAAAAWVFFRRRQDLARLFPPAPVRPPEEIARERLENLKQKNYPGQGEFKPYYIELSDILRRYLEDRLRIPAIDRTTHELMRELKNSVIKRPEVLHIREFLENSDMVKFAKYLPKPQEAETDWELVSQIIAKVAENFQETATTAAGELKA